MAKYITYAYDIHDTDANGNARTFTGHYTLKEGVKPLGLDNERIADDDFIINAFER